MKISQDSKDKLIEAMVPELEEADGVNHRRRISRAIDAASDYEALTDALGKYKEEWGKDFRARRRLAQRERDFKKSL